LKKNAFLNSTRLGRRDRAGEFIKHHKALFLQRLKGFVLGRRNTFLDLLDLFPEGVIVLQKPAKPPVLQLQAVNDFAFAGEFLGKIIGQCGHRLFLRDTAWRLEVAMIGRKRQHHEVRRLGAAPALGYRSGMHDPVLILGADGRLGAHLACLPGAVGIGRAGFDLTAPDGLGDLLRAHKPVAVINAAAMTDVNKAEAAPGHARRVNGEAPAHIAALCAAAGVGFVHVSTDYVFGAEGHDRPRRETDPPAPMNLYGHGKLAGEIGVQAEGGRSCCVRVAWLFGGKGDFIDRMLHKARTQAVIQVTNQAGTPTPLAPLAKGLMAIAARLASGAQTPSILHLAGQPLTDRAAWVEEALAGAPPGLALARLERVDLDTFPDAAARPRGTPLDTSLYQSLFGPAPDWRAPARAWGNVLLRRDPA
jgi:dTDP-4-dehydrorhamnose reductase